MTSSSRRDVKSRNTRSAQKVARILAEAGISPNMISVFSVVFSILSLVFFVLSQENIYFLIAAVLMIQLRLLCNLFDGMVAVEYNKKTEAGELFNEVPDRLSDFFIILGAGLCIKEMPYAMEVAWINIFLATLTAYIRVFGAALVGRHYFSGPMSKQHRMFLISLGALASLFYKPAMYGALILMLVLLVVTNVRRLSFIAKDLKLKASAK